MRAETLERPIVLLDLDNTILDFNAAERAALSRTLTELGVPFDDGTLARYNKINIQHWELLEDGILTREEVLVKRFEALYREMGVEADAWWTQDRYETLLSEGHWFMPGAEELLEALRPYCRLFIVSNGARTVQDARLRSAGIGPYFEQIFISEEVGAEKPTREFFDRCFAAIPELDLRRAVLVGDSLTSDIRGAKNAGLLSVWYNYRGRPARPDIVPDYEIRALSELPTLLRRLFPEAFIKT